MKKILLLIVLFTQIILAQSSSVTVFSEEGERFYVIVNGIRQNDAPATNVVVTDLEKPNYLFKIIFEDQKISSINENVYLEGVDGRTNVAFVLRKNKKGKMQMRVSSFDYDVATKPSKNTQVVKYHTEENPISNATKPEVIKENVTTKATEKVETDTNVMGINMNTQVIVDENENMNMNVNVGGMNTDIKVSSTSNSTTTTTKDQPNIQTKAQISNNLRSTEESLPIEKKEFNSKPNTTASKTCTSAMSSQNFNTAKSSISKQAFAETKMKTAKQILNANCLSVEQIIEVMDLFSFEENKLDFAKAAYLKCVDKSQFFMVNDAFSFSSSVDELTDFIESITE